MYIQRIILTGAVLSALAPSSSAQSSSNRLPTVVVTASPFRVSEGDQILTPAKVLAGDELRNKLGSTLGETLSTELGVSSSAFGAGASRPIIRGLEGNRVKILENGMSVSDLSGLSNDHGISSESATARQIEILRGPAALLYGSGAIGGLINVVNERIPTFIPEVGSGQLETRYSSVDQGRSASFSADGQISNVAVHVDGSGRNASDYDIRSSTDGGILPNSFSRQSTLGAGASWIGSKGFLGVSVSTLDKLYGLPGGEGSRIDLQQTRYDLDSRLANPLPGIEGLRAKIGYVDYGHTELNSEQEPETLFANRALETRIELDHVRIAGWKGSFGIQTEHARFSAINADNGEAATVPLTVSDSRAAFLVEERDFRGARVSLGARIESVERDPLGSARKRSFDLFSYSAGAQWPLAAGITAGVTISVAERAPGADELYSRGPHESTLTYDIGDPNFQKERSHNLELSLRKDSGLLNWQANVFENRVRNFIYGEINGVLLDDDGAPGDELRERIFRQANARIRGAEAEVSYNWHRTGLSARLFADMSRGTLDAGSLPLQPASRVGSEIGYRQGRWSSGVTMLRVLRQNRLAAFESTPTDAYTQLEANLSWVQRLRDMDLTWFAIARNLLDQDIRVSTSVLKDVAPLAGRSLSIGVRARF